MARTKAQIEAYERDGEFCQWCQYRKNRLIMAVDAHHIGHRRPGGDVAELIICLCRDCHDGYHRGKEPNRSQLLDLVLETRGINLREKYPEFFAKY